MGAIRLFLAIAVLQSHIRAHFLAPAGLSVMGNKLTLGVNGGYAVVFFFVVSGFLISFVLEQKYDRPDGDPEFYCARAIRIYPLWWTLYLLVPFLTDASLWNFVTHHHVYDLATGFFIFGSDLLLSFWTYPTNYTAPMPHGLELGWTLASEITFYLIAPFVFRSKFLPLAIFAASLLLRVAIDAIIPADQQQHGEWEAWCYYFLPSTIMFFMAGHLARVIYRSFRLPIKWAWVTLASAAIPLLIQDARFGFENVYLYLAIVLFALSLPAIFAATKDSKICNFLGDLTYPLYLSHGVLIVLMESRGSFLYVLGKRVRAIDIAWAPGHHHAWIRTVCISLSIWIIAIAVAAGVHFLLEKPAAAGVRFLFSLFDRKRPVQTVPVGGSAAAS